MDDATTYTSVESILEELAYLSLRRHELVIEDKSQIGAGEYGEVLSAKLRKPNEKDEDVAVKCVWAVGTMGDRRRFAMRFARELKIWASIRHLNILPLVGFYLSGNYEIAQLVSPFLANGNVVEYISRTKPQREKRMGFVCDMAAGLDFLHNHSPPICHGDLKPANVLVSDSYEAMLCDFGLASLVDKSGAASGLTTSRSIKGSTRYMSPELILGTDEKHTLASDVWAWACTTFEIITDCVPYSEAIGERQIMLAILRGDAPGRVRMLMEGADSDRDGGPYFSAGSGSLLSLVSTCWSFTPIERPMIREILEQVFPTWDRNPSRRGASRIGSVRVRSRVLTDSSHHFAMVGPCVRIMINGLCNGTASFDAAMHDGTSTFLDVEVEVQNFREVIVLEATCLLDGTKRILGTVGIGVRDLAIRNSGSIVQLHHYALRRLEGQISMEYKLEFTQELAVHGSIHGSNPDDFDISGSASSGEGSFYTAESAHSDRNRDQNHSHKESGSVGGAAVNLITGIEGSTWPASSHPYANATPTNDVDDQPYYNTRHMYKAGRGPFAPGGDPSSLGDIKRRTIKVTMCESEQAKLTRTMDISDCNTGIGVLQTALKKFKKSTGLGHSGDDDDSSGERDQGGLVVGGWGMFVDGVNDESLVKPLTEAEILNICHSDSNSPARERLTLRRVRKDASFEEKPPPRPLRVSQSSLAPANRIKETRFDDLDNSGNNSLAVPESNSPPPRPNASSKKISRATTASIMSGLGGGPTWPGLANLPAVPPTPPGGVASSVTMEASVGKEATEKSRNFFGQRPPSDLIYTHQQDFFPNVEKKVLERTAIARQSIFGGNTGPNSKRNSFGQRPPSNIISIHQPDFFPTVEEKGLERTATARQSIVRGDTGPNSKRTFRQRPPSDLIYTHQQEFFPTVEEKVLEKTAIARQIIFGGNTGPNSKRNSFGQRPPSDIINIHQPDFFPTVEEKGLERTATVRQSIVGGDTGPNSKRMFPGQRPPSDLIYTHQQDFFPAVEKKVLERTAIARQSIFGGNTGPNSKRMSIDEETLSAEFARSLLLQESMRNKRTSFLPEPQSKRHTSDTANMLTLDEIAKKVESRRQSLMGVGTSGGLILESGGEDEEGETRRSTAIEEAEYEEDKEEGGTSVENEEEDDNDEEEDEEHGDDGMPKKTTSKGNKRVIKWVKGALIGSGSFGSVYLGMDARQGLSMAVKQVSLPTGNSANEERKKIMLGAVKREIDLLKQLQHEHIVQYLDSSIDDQHLNIFLEYVPGSSITTLLKNYGAFEESLVKLRVQHILSGLNYLHEKGIIHRDIKGANILVDNRGGIKISDFGISKKMEDVDVLAANARGHRASLQGSVFWMAPEVVKQSGHTSKADIWSVGCVIVEMLTGEHPFPKASQMQAIFRIGSFAKPDTPPDISPEAEDFLAKTFEIDHNLRPSATELLQHPWQTMP